MKCNKAMEHFLKLDKYENLGLKLRVHIFLCGNCRREMKMLTESLNSLRASSPFMLESGISSRIMKIISVMPCETKHEISSFKWLFAGSVILSGIVAIPYNKELDFLRLYFGANFELPLVIVLGLVITLYSVIYIATHVEEIKNSISFYDKKR